MIKIKEWLTAKNEIVQFEPVTFDIDGGIKVAKRLKDGFPFVKDESLGKNLFKSKDGDILYQHSFISVFNEDRIHVYINFHISKIIDKELKTIKFQVERWEINNISVSELLKTYKIIENEFFLS